MWIVGGTGRCFPGQMYSLLIVGGTGRYFPGQMYSFLLPTNSVGTVKV